MSFKLKVDKSVWNRMKVNLRKVDNTELQVGFFDKYYGPENDNLPVATVAMWNEEGEGIPKRSFIREGFIENIQNSALFDVTVLYKLGLVAEGKMNMSQLLASIGPELAKSMQQEILNFSTPRNAPLTIALKGKDDPLRDSDTMLNSVEWQIGSKGVS